MLRVLYLYIGGIVSYVGWCWDAIQLFTLFRVCDQLESKTLAERQLRIGFIECNAAGIAGGKNLTEYRKLFCID